MLDHGKPDGSLLGRAADVVAARGIAVHRRIGPRGNVERADDVLGEHGVERVVQRHPERGLPPHVLEDAARRFGRGERRGHGSSVSACSQARFARSWSHMVSLKRRIRTSASKP